MATMVPLAAEMAQSIGLRWFTAATMPAGRAMSRVTTSAANASSSVAGMRWARRSETGRLVKNETPRSPRTTLPSHNAYCAGRGWSKPLAARTASMASGVAFEPAITAAASPGMSRNMPKMRTLDSNTTGMA